MWKFDTYFVRQTCTLSATFLHSLAMGFMMSFPSVLQYSINSQNYKDFTITDDQISNTAAVIGVSGMMTSLIQVPIMHAFGRKTILIALNVVLIIGWVIVFIAQNVTTLYIGRFVQGVASASLFFNATLVSEYSHPSRRGFYTAIKKICGATGGLICHTLPLYFSWRIIAFVSSVPAMLSVLIVFIQTWPESPSFLAVKGRFEECKDSFIWLHGEGTESQKHLNQLISSQKEKFENGSQLKQISLLSEFRDIIFKKNLLKCFLIVMCLIAVVEMNGRHYYGAYTIRILSDVTGDTSIGIFSTIGSDVLNIIAFVASTFILTSFDRRTLLLRFGGFSAVLMISIGFLKLFKSFDVTKWLILSVLLLHGFNINLSVVPVIYTLYGELFPSESRGVASALSNFVGLCFVTIVLKVTPLLVNKIDVEGTYFVFGVCVTFLLYILNYVLPETKNRTLQDIEDEMKGCNKITSEITEPLLA